MLSAARAIAGVQGSQSLPGKTILHGSSLLEELVTLTYLGYSACTAGPYLWKE